MVSLMFGLHAVCMAVKGRIEQAFDWSKPRRCACPNSCGEPLGYFAICNSGGAQWLSETLDL